MAPRLRHTDNKRIRDTGERVRCADTSGCCDIECSYSGDVEVTITGVAAGVLQEWEENTECTNCTAWNAGFVISKTTINADACYEESGTYACLWRDLDVGIDLNCDPANYSEGVWFGLFSSGSNHEATCRIHGNNGGGVASYKKTQTGAFSFPIVFTSDDEYQAVACLGIGRYPSPPPLYSPYRYDDCDFGSATVTITMA